ncbi:MAG: hypothetical protein AAGE59_04180 [Cyanobacteria bacterium P01_F01_bin.86]
MVDSKTAARRKLKLQFSYYDSTLPTRLADDIRCSSFTTRPKYLNALLEKVLSLPVRTSTSSHIDEFFAWIELFESLPTDRISQLAPTQNRNFDQMVKHLLEIALSYYPENPQMSVAARDVHSHKAEGHQPELADYGRWPDMNYPPGIRHHSS